MYIVVCFLHSYLIIKDNKEMISNFVSTSFKYSEANYCKLLQLLQTYCSIMQYNTTQQTAASLLNQYFFDSVSNNDALKYLLQDY